MKYKALSNIKINGEQHKANDIVELTDDAEALSLVADGIVEVVGEQEVVKPEPPLTTGTSSTPPLTPPAPTGVVLPNLSGPMVPTPNGTTPAQVQKDLADMESSSQLQNNGPQA